MIAVKAIRKFDPGSCTFGTWLRGIANNVLRNESRKVGRDRVVAWHEAAVEPVAEGPEAELGENVTAVLQALPEDYRSALLAKYCDGLAVNEIAAASGRPP